MISQSVLSKNYKNDFLFIQFNKMECIGTFKDIFLRQNSLVLCDIDDTVFDYGKEVDDYWKQKINDPNYEIWHSIIKRITPILTDSYFYTFLDNIEKSNSVIHFITHRSDNFKDITKKHMKHYNLDHIETHHLSGSSKAKYINENFDLNNFEGGILFIDDSNNNVNDVANNIPNSNVYLFKK